jgi:hypothetical protein
MPMYYVCVCMQKAVYIECIVIYPGSDIALQLKPMVLSLPLHCSSISLAQQCESVRVLASFFTSCADSNSSCNNCNCDRTVVLIGAHL